MTRTEYRAVEMLFQEQAYRKKAREARWSVRYWGVLALGVGVWAALAPNVALIVIAVCWAVNAVLGHYSEKWSLKAANALRRLRRMLGRVDCEDDGIRELLDVGDYPEAKP